MINPKTGKEETTAEKTARLRALRYARDGHPDDIKAAERLYREYQQKMRAARADAAMKALCGEMDRLGVERFAEKYLGLPKK